MMQQQGDNDEDHVETAPEASDELELWPLILSVGYGGWERTDENTQEEQEGREGQQRQE